MALRRPAPATFELGLVMAGAVSAGAYTAGVLDFLYEALGAWEEAKLLALQKGATIPDHKVMIRACSGASAGGICSALAAMVPFCGHTPVVNPPQTGANTGNLFYDTWVKNIDISSLLTVSDISADQAPPSLLNGLALDEVANGIVSATRKAIAGGAVQKPSWLANPLQLYFSIGNIRGVPYLIQMVAADPIRGHRTVTHGDYAHFVVRDASALKPESLPVGASPINWPGTQGDKNRDGWDYLASAALSTSAFPVGLPSRQFMNPRTLYDAKLWNRLPGSSEDGASPTIAPDLPPATLDPNYMFWTVDGGVYNNEPLEYARIALSGSPDAHNARDARLADRAVLMIDPFPDDAGRQAEMGFAGKEGPDILKVLFVLLGTMKSQSRFKPDEIRLALHEDVHSRFLIAPSRGDRTGTQTNLAADGMAGFAGFLHERFRAHDFFLGRRNCQQFLRNHLVVHRENPIVQPWVAKLKAAGQLDSYHPRYRSIPNGPMVADEDFVQLIPLYGTAAKDCAPAPWPKLAKADLNVLKTGMQKRADKVANAGIESVLKLLGMQDGLIGDLLGWFAKNKLRNLIRDRALEAIEKDLSVRELL